LTTLFTPNGGKLGQMVETAKHRKSLENTGKISIFKAFYFGAEGGIRTLWICSLFNMF
jgi:hypothetical protein